MKNQFDVLYNGHPVEVTALENDVFLVQVTYKPLRIQLKNGNGKEQWIDMETQQETYVSNEIGKLIAGRLNAV